MPGKKITKNILINGVDNIKTDDNNTDRRYALPYPMELGSPAFAPVPIREHKDIVLNNSKQLAKQEYDRIMEVVAVLEKQARDIARRMEISQVMHDCHYQFKPVVGNVYYVYHDEQKNRNWLSLSSPEQWMTLSEHHRYVMSVQFMADSSWQEITQGNSHENKI
jgi:hypothetical protein